MEKHYGRGLIWLGLLVMIAGGGILYISLFGSSEGMHAPRWVIAAAGGMFFSAGVLVGSMDTAFNSFRDQKWFAAIQLLALLTVPLGLMIPTNWVAFGPGEREFSVSISIPFLSGYFPNANQILGRIFFGIPALFMDVIALGVFGKLAWDWVNEGRTTTARRIP
jgi:hypothetical protein